MFARSRLPAVRRSCGEQWRAARGWCALGTLMLGAAASASEPGLNQRIDGERQAALELVEQAQRLDARTIDGYRRLAVYVAAGGPGGSLRSATVAMDADEPLRHEFEAGEAQAVSGQNLFRLAVITVDGPHVLHAVLSVAHAVDGSPETAELSADIPVDPRTDSVELVPVPAGWLSDASLQNRQWHAVLSPSGGLLGRAWAAVGGGEGEGRVYTQGSAEDPRVRHARYLEAAGDFLHAAAAYVVLLEGVTDSAQRGPLAVEEARSLTAYGALALAAKAYESAVKEGVDAKTEMGLRLELAEQFYQRGDDASAEFVLAGPPTYFAEAYTARWQDLKARILLGQGRDAAAMALLQQIANTGDYESWVRYYNLGVLLLRQDTAQQGLTVLDRVGTLPAASSELQALQDRANLTLGEYFLRHGQSATAIPVLGRIHSRGPFANRAFLDLGWAWMGPAGDVQQRMSLGDERTVGPPPGSIGSLRNDIGDQNLYQRFKLQPFAQQRLGRDTEARRRHALAMWSELLERDPGDEAVQEGLIAAGDALEQIGAHDSSRALYEKVQQSLQRTHAELGVAGHTLASGMWAGACDNTLLAGGAQPHPAGPMALAPTAPVASALAAQFAGRDFSGAIEACAALRGIARELREDDARLADDADVADDAEYAAWHERSESLLQELAASQSTITARLAQQVDAGLSQHLQRNEGLLRDAELRVARLYDDASTGGSASAGPAYVAAPDALAQGGGP